MDHWSNLNLNQAYGRLPTPANAAGLNRFDLHLLEQQGFTTAGLGAAAGLSNPLPAHATLSPAAAAARSFTTGLPHVNYGALPMAPLFDSMAQLTQGFAAVNQSPYRTAMQAVSSQPTVYAIDAAGHPVSSAGRFVASIVAATSGSGGDTQLKTVSMFNTDPHTMADPVASAGGNAINLPASSMASHLSYGSRSSGHAAPANPYSGLPTNYATGASALNRYAAGKIAVSVSAGEPPPAHSGSRLNTATRTPSYPMKDFTQPPITVQRPQLSTTASQSRDIQPQSTSYNTLEHRPAESNPPTAHSNLHRPGDDLMQKILLSYGPRGQTQAVNIGRGLPATSFTSSHQLQVAQALANVGGRQQQDQGYVDPSRSAQRATTSTYHNFSIASPIHYAPGYGQASQDVMEELSYDDVSSPEGIGLRDAAATLAGNYMQGGNKVTAVIRNDNSIASENATRHIVQACSAQVNNRQNSIVLGRISAIPDPTIQAQADSTTRPKKGGGGGRAVRVGSGDIGSERGGKRSRSGSSKSRGKGKNEDDAVQAGLQTIPDLSGYGGQVAYAQLLPADFNNTSGQGYVTADGFAQYRVASDPYQVAAAECMIAAAGRQDLSQRRMATIDAMSRSESSNIQQQEAQVFMTNMFGNAFVNPNELLSVEQITFVDASEGNSATYATQPVNAVQKPDPQHRPIIEEEFGHLAADPTPTMHAPVQSVTSLSDLDRPLAAGNVTTVGEQQKSPAESKPLKPQASPFMNSFMNFLQGKKPETLASVSTSVATKKPVLPKYIPEPPRPKPPPAPAVVTNPKPPQATGKASDAIVVQFSDDEEEESHSKRIVSNIKNAVNKALSSLSADVASVKKSTSSVAAMPGGVGKSHGRPLKSSLVSPTTLKVTSSSKPSLKKTKGVIRGSKSKKWVDGGVVSDDDEEVVILETPPVVARERSKRKAKEVALQKNRPSKAKKGKRGVPVVFESDTDASIDDVEPDSDNDDARSMPERDYDSDKDPAWRPHFANQPSAKKVAVNLSSGSDDDRSKVQSGSRGRPRPRGRQQSLTAARIQPRKNELSTATSTKIAEMTSSNPAKQMRAATKKVDEQVSSMEPTLKNALDTNSQDITKSEKEELQEAFGVYVQTLVSQVLEPSFLSALLAQPDDYYTEPLQKINAILVRKKEELTLSHQWNHEFLANLEKCSLFVVKADVEPGLRSEASANTDLLATRRIHFGGCTYNAGTLDSTTDVVDGSVKDFLASSDEADALPSLHALYHFRYNLLQDCRMKVAKLKMTDSGVQSDQLLDHCLQDQLWMQQMFDRFWNLVQ